jgi:hypothetical protein
MGLYYPTDKGKPKTGKRRQLAAMPLGHLEGIITPDRGECWPVVSTFHFLRDRLEYDRDATQDFHRFLVDGNTLDEWIYRWAQSRQLGEAFVGSSLDDAHSLDHDFSWWVFDEGDPHDLIAVVQTCDQLALSLSSLYVFRVSQLEDLIDFRRAIVSCLGSPAYPAEDDTDTHVFCFTGDEWEEYLVTNDGWHSNPHGDDPFTNVLPLGERGEKELPDDPEGVIYYSPDWEVYYCPRCAHEFDVEGPGL